MFELDIPTTAAMANAADGLQAYNNFNAFSSIAVGSSASLNVDYAQLVANATTFDWCNQSLFSGNSSNNCSVDSSSANNTANSTAPVDDISFILPWWRQVLWSILFGGMVIVATGGNLIVVWIVMTTKRMCTVTNYFIESLKQHVSLIMWFLLLVLTVSFTSAAVNLSVVDAMVSSLNAIFNYIYMLDNVWQNITVHSDAEQCSFCHIFLVVNSANHFGSCVLLERRHRTLWL